MSLDFTDLTHRTIKSKRHNVCLCESVCVSIFGFGGPAWARRKGWFACHSALLCIVVELVGGGLSDHMVEGFSL